MYFHNTNTNNHQGNDDIASSYHDILTQDLLDEFQTDWDPQEAILLSDPNFLRQHQLLQEQQKEMQSRLSEREPMSNLSAMFEKQDQQLLQHEQQQQQMQLQSQQQQQQQQQFQPLQQQPTQPQGSPLIDNKKEETLKDDIDHHRRLSELQARFRVNYARKPQQQQQQQKSNGSRSNQMIGTSAPQDKSYLLQQQQQHQQQQHNQPQQEDNNLSSSFPSRTMPIQIQRVSRPNQSHPFDAEIHQRQLDDQLDKVNFDDITVSELKEMLRQRGKPATGKKAILLQRLQDERKSKHRYSQPIPSTNEKTTITTKQERPRSFQSSLPMTIQLPPNNMNMGYHSLSPTSPYHFVPSPASPGASLHRSIANMHIGSPPPPSVSRRYSPYSPRSPKINLSSSVPSHVDDSNHHQQQQQALISPINMFNNNDDNDNTNNNSDTNIQQQSRPSCRYYNQKSYKPFTSSALATPDREEINPFDSYYNEPMLKHDEEEEEEVEQSQSQQPQSHQQEMIQENDNSIMTHMDWLDPSLDVLLQQVTSQHDSILLSNENLENLLLSQQEQGGISQIHYSSSFDPSFFH